MLLFILFFTLLLALILLPVLVGGQRRALKNIDDSLQIRMQQLKQEFQFRNKELARRLKSGDLDEDEFQQLSQELELDTATSIESTQQASASGTTNRSVWGGAALVVFAVVIAAVSYSQTKSYEKANSHMKLVGELKNNPDYIASLTAEVEKSNSQESLERLYQALRTQIDLKPTSLEAWRALGQFNSRVGRTEEALETYQLAEKIAPDSLTMKVEIAQVYAASKSADDVAKATSMLKTVLAQNPNHEGALATMGFVAFSAKNYPLAIESWKKLLGKRDPDSRSAKMLAQSIAVAEEKLGQVEKGLMTEAKQEEVSEPTNHKASLLVEVTIPESVKNTLNGNEAVFIFAKAASGPPLPLAVVRTSVNAISGTISLSDANAMQPEFSLSKFDQVKVTARISRSGVAIAKPGDIQGESQTLSAPFNQQAVKLEINQVVK